MLCPSPFILVARHQNRARDFGHAMRWCQVMYRVSEPAE